MFFWKSNSSSNNTNGHDNGNGNGDCKRSKEKINYKARLEHKQYLASASPEPVYDLSECGLKTLPSGVYANCKIQRKEALLLQNNDLISLNGGLADLASCLQVLDIHNNQLEKLPDEIGLLKQLRVLYVQNNKLKKLPEKLSELKLLQSLDVSANLFKELPEAAFSSLKRLKTLKVCQNPKLKKLPKSLAHCHSLQTIEVDQTLQYPNTEVIKQGTQGIMKFLAKECDITYVDPLCYEPPEDSNDDLKNRDVNDDPYERIVKGNLKLIDKQKEEKLKEMARIEREREEAVVRETLLAQTVASKKKQLLTDLAQEEAKREDVVRKMQQMKDKEKDALISSLQNAEGRTDALITELMASSSRTSDPQKVLEEIEKERREMEEIFSIKAGKAEKLREQEIKSAMLSVIEEELKREALRRKYEEGRKYVINSALSSELESDRAVEQVLAAQGKQKSALISSLLEDEKYQRDAFAALLINQDARHKQICSHVEQIQAELASLTMVEMTKRDLQVEFENDAMKEKRETLTGLLMNLMNQREERQNELTNRLREMEDNRTVETENYWLIQYQKLLDSRPKSLQKAEENMDSGLKEILSLSGAEEYGPILAMRGITSKELVYMRDRELTELGLHNTYLRQKLMKCAEEYQARQDNYNAATLGNEHKNGSNATPSAPPMNGNSHESASTAPSAPPMIVETFQSSECVVCLEMKCDILFLPCGHVCSCWKCESTLTSCPLCRSDIIQKVKLQNN